MAAKGNIKAIEFQSLAAKPRIRVISRTVAAGFSMALLNTFPLSFKVRDKRIAIIGGGEEALNKVQPE